MCKHYCMQHTCNCFSRLQLDRCRTAIVTSSVCTLVLPIDVDGASTTHKSHFKCYDCIHREARAEHEGLVDKIQRKHEQGVAKQQCMQAAEAEARTRKECVRAAAQENACVEGGLEMKKKEEDITRAKRVKEGGLWVDAGASRRKGKGRRGGGGGDRGANGTGDNIEGPFSSPNTPVGAPLSPVLPAADRKAIQTSSINDKVDTGMKSANSITEPGDSPASALRALSLIDSNKKIGNVKPKLKPKPAQMKILSREASFKAGAGARTWGPKPPLSAPLPERSKTAGTGTGLGEVKGLKVEPLKSAGVDPGGRAGVWPPKKILTKTDRVKGRKKQEDKGVVLGSALQGECSGVLT